MRMEAVQVPGTTSPTDAPPTAAAPAEVGNERQFPACTREPFRLLLSALERRGVRYCHWKSNIRLEQSLSGGGDLDLLVEREDAAGFEAALNESGFRPARSPRGLGFPGVFHAFALDPGTARLLHLHAYFQVVTGDSLVKSYRLPVEDALLAGARRLHGVPVPSAEAELVLFALRIALKHTSLAEILLVSRDRGALREELVWLCSDVDIREAEALWAAWLPGVPPGTFRELLNAIAAPRRVGRRIRLGRRLARHLGGWRRLGRIPAAASRAWRVGMLMLGRLSRRRPLLPLSGGAIIALVGPKATGKSTLAAAMSRRLGQHYDVRRIHVGHPPATALTLPVRLFLPSARRLLPAHRSGAYEEPERRRERRWSLLHVLRLTIVAYERRALLRRSQRAAASGAIVLCDRYPSASAGATDSSRFDEDDLARAGPGLKRWLMQRERALYADLPRPRLVIRLSAPLETALGRDAEREKEVRPNPAAVARRRRLETAAAFPGSREIVVSTDEPLETTIGVVTRAVWAAL